MVMENGRVPLRHSINMPFMVRLPRRYEIYQLQALRRRRASLQPVPETSEGKEGSYGPGDSMQRRRASLQPNPISDSHTDREQDLHQAIQWVTQELIFLRQHDVLLKRQFHNIGDTLARLINKRNSSSSSDKTPTETTSDNSPDGSGDIQPGMLRSASSVTALNESSNDADDSDDEEFTTCRSRSNSSVTSRDLAAVARRRGSKDVFV